MKKLLLVLAATFLTLSLTSCTLTTIPGASCYTERYVDHYDSHTGAPVYGYRQHCKPVINIDIN